MKKKLDLLSRAYFAWVVHLEGCASGMTSSSSAKPLDKAVDAIREAQRRGSGGHEHDLPHDRHA